MAPISKQALAQEGPIFFTPPLKAWDKRLFKGGSAPPPPDPVATANAQADANIKAAQQQAVINRTDSVTPFGTTKWSQDPNNPDKWTQNLTLDPKVQGMLDQFYASSGQALPAIDTSKLPGISSSDLSGYGKELQSAYANIMGSPTGVADNSGAIARTNGLAQGAGDVLAQLQQQGKDMYSKPLDYSSLGDLPQADEAARQKIQDALYGQYARTLDPSWQQQQSDMASSLAAQGINLGTDAYDRATGNFARDKNDAYQLASNNSITNSTDQMQKLFNMAMARRQQGVSEANYLYNLPMDLMTKGTGNYGALESTLNQDYATNLAQQQGAQAIRSQQLSDALANIGTRADMTTQQHNLTSADRNTMLNEQLATHNTALSDRNNILNQLMAMASGSQVANPAQVQVGAAPVAQSIYNSYQGQLSNYNAQQQSANANTAAGAGALGTAAMAAAVFF